MKRKNKKDAGYMDGTPNITMKSLLFFILLAGSFGIFNTASAGTLDVVNTNGETIRFTVSLNKDVYNPTPESIEITASAYSWASTDNIISLSATTNGVTIPLISTRTISPSSDSGFLSGNLTGLSSPGSSSVVFSASVYTDPIPPPPAEIAVIDMYIDSTLVAGQQSGTYQVIKSNANGLEYTISMSSGVNTGLSPSISVPSGPYIILQTDANCRLLDSNVTSPMLYDTFWLYTGDYYTVRYTCPDGSGGGGAPSGPGGGGQGFE